MRRTHRARLGLTLVVAVGLLARGPAQAAPPKSLPPMPLNPCAGPKPANPCASPANPCGARPARPASAAVESLLDEFLATSRAVAGTPAGEAEVEFAGPREAPRWFDALMVTHAENPLLEEECKKQALQISVDTLRAAHGIDDEDEAIRAAARHIQQHQDFVRSHGISYSGYLREIAECRAFCGPLVAHLVECHVLAVSRSVHGIVLFGLDSDRVDALYERGVLRNVARLLAGQEDRKVVLIGRASRVGDLRYNRRLAARRALAVRDRLIDAEVPRGRIETMWFGWEPPQISPWIADQYGLMELLEREGAQRVNQSVLLVVY